MKKRNFLILAAMMIVLSCNNSGKSPVEEADSINDANRDTMVNNNQGIIADEQSADFLVRAANSGKAELEITTLAREKATRPAIKDFATMLHHDHEAVSAKVRELAQQRNVTLPDSMTADKIKDVKDLRETSADNFDKAFIRKMIDAHDAGINLFEKAEKDAKDADVRSFASGTLPKLRVHRDSAKALLDRFW